MWWECINARAPDPKKKLAQATRDMAAAVKRGKRDFVHRVVVWHRMSERTIHATLTLADLIALMADDMVLETLLHTTRSTCDTMLTVDFADLCKLLHEE